MYCLRLSTRNLRPHSLLTCRPLSRLSRYTAAEESCCQGCWGCQGQEGPGHPRQGGEGRLNSLSTLRAIHIFTRPAVYSHDNRSHLALSGGVFHRPPRTSLVPLPHALCQHLSPSPVTPSPSHPSPASSVLSECLRSQDLTNPLLCFLPQGVQGAPCSPALSCPTDGAPFPRSLSFSATLAPPHLPPLSLIPPNICLSRM